MEDNRKQRNVLILAVSGIVACLVGVGVVFLFSPKNNSNLKGNDTNSSSEQEVILGDAGSCGNGPAYDNMSSCSAVDCGDIKTQNSCNSTQGCCTWQESQVTPCSSYGISNCPTWCYKWTSTNTCSSQPEPEPSPSTDPSPSGQTVDCWQLSTQRRSCTSVTISGTSCSSSNGYYSSLDGCRSQLSCQETEFIPNASCTSCGANKTSSRTNCHGTAEECCHDIEPPAQDKCYCNPINGKCEWRSTNANNWEYMTNITTEAQCQAYNLGGSEACFKKTSDGKYYWGAYGSVSGYTYVMAADETACNEKNKSNSSGSSI